MKHGTAIEWTHVPGYKGESWNPVGGCSHASSGCKNCYAERQAIRLPDHPEEEFCDFFEVAELPTGPMPTLDWIIAGGERGPRPPHPDWFRSVRDHCAAAGVPFLFKQWGDWAPHRPVAGGDLGGDVRAGRVRFVHPTGQSDVEISEATGGRSTIAGSRYMARIGKRNAGRLLDGNAFPLAVERQDAPASVATRGPSPENSPAGGGPLRGGAADGQQI